MLEDNPLKSSNFKARMKATLLGLRKIMLYDFENSSPQQLATIEAELEDEDDDEPDMLV